MNSADPHLSTAQSPVHMEDLLGAVESLNELFVVVCLKSMSVLSVSRNTAEQFPQFKTGMQWSALAASEPALLELTEPFFTSDARELVADVSIANVNTQVALKRCTGPRSNSDYCLLVFQREHDLLRNLHQYMEERDSLFSTSRTISVSEMATTLAHELNTPIGTISNILRGVQMRLGDADISAEQLENALSRALEQTRFTQSVISRIRDFTQARRPKYRVLDMREQVTGAVSLLDWLLKQSRCKVEFLFPEKAVHVFGDATMLQQVLINLIRNAVDAMEGQSTSGRAIRIAVEAENEKVRIAVEDNGQGLEGNADNLFVPFATDKSTGMGVGLNICRSFVELHQGRLWLTPNESKGCTSYVELPLAAQFTESDDSLLSGAAENKAPESNHESNEIETGKSIQRDKRMHEPEPREPVASSAALE